MSRSFAVVLLALVAVGIGFAIGTEGAGIGLLIVAAGAGAALALAVIARLRSSAIGDGVGLIQYLGFWLLGLATLLITFNGFRVTSFLTIADLVLVLVGVVFAFAVLVDQTLISGVPRSLIVGGVGLLIAGFIASFSAQNVAGDIVASAEFAIALLGVPILLAHGTASVARVLFISRVWVLSALLNAGIAITDYTHVTSIGALVGGGRPTSLTDHPNHLGIACAMAVPIALFLAITARRRLVSASYYGALAVISLGVLVSGSRAALLAGLAGAVAVPVLGRRVWKPVAVMTVAAAGLLLASSLVISPDQASPTATNPFVAIERLTNETAISSSDTARLDYYSTALRDFSSHPLTGVGFETVRDAHDIYLQLVQAGGILAFVSFVIFALGSLALGVSLTRSRALDGNMRNLAAALTASLAIWLLGGLVQNYIYDRFLYLPVGLLIGLKVAAVRNSDAVA